MGFVGIANLGSNRMEALEARYKLGSKRLKGVIFNIDFSEIVPVPCKGLSATENSTRILD